MSNMTVEQWKELLTEIGLDKEQMHRWHHLFENRYPEGHESFLQWLGLDAAAIKRIRANSK